MPKTPGSGTAVPPELPPELPPDEVEVVVVLDGGGVVPPDVVVVPPVLELLDEVELHFLPPPEWPQLQ